MKHFIPLLFVLLISFVYSGCAGNGQGLDENGNPIGGDGNGLPIAFEPTFSNIQQNVFDPICTRCHVGPSAPQGMQLDAQNSYRNIVGVTSNERPDLKRVQPGDPDLSYIVHKLEGGPNIVGSQMPLNLPPLSQPTINSIRIWISRGAAQD